jgi:hypothetical protein
VNFVGDDCDQGLQEGRCRVSVSLLVELRESKLRCAVNRDKQVKFAFFSAHFSDIDVEVADRVSLERLLAPRLAFDRRKPADLVALEQSMQRRSPEMRDGRLEGIKAIVERQQRMLAERNSESFLLGAEYR